MTAYAAVAIAGAAADEGTAHGAGDLHGGPCARFICAECGNMFASRSLWEKHCMEAHDLQRIAETDSDEDDQPAQQPQPEPRPADVSTVSVSKFKSKSRSAGKQWKGPQAGHGRRARDAAPRSVTPSAPAPFSRPVPPFVTCTVCNKNFYSKRTLELHARDTHSMSLDRRPEPPARHMAETTSKSNTHAAMPPAQVTGAGVVHAVQPPPVPARAPYSVQSIQVNKEVLNFVTCTTCGANFYTIRSLRHHMLEHGTVLDRHMVPSSKARTASACDGADKESLSPDARVSICIAGALHSGKNKIQVERVVTVADGGKDTASAGQLAVGAGLGKPVTVTACQQCGRKFTTPKSLQKHTSVKHPQASPG